MEGAGKERKKREFGKEKDGEGLRRKGWVGGICKGKDEEGLKGKERGVWERKD
jgi:hypothetical protein